MPESTLEKSAPKAECFTMSVAELKKAVDELEPEQRLELAEYIRWRSTKDDPDWQRELARRLNNSLAGSGRPRDELLQLHDRLNAVGR
jgi:hypothetical protein